MGLGQDVGTALRAVARLNGQAALKVLIAGDGKGLAAVRALVAELRLADAEIRPPVPLEELSALLARGDIHLICQQPGTEGLLVPSKIYSTLAAGRPSLFIGPVECEVGRIVRESGSGFVIEPGDVEEAADVLRRLATNPALQHGMGRNARIYYEQHFGRERSVSRIIGILEAAGNGNGRGLKSEIRMSKSETSSKA
ncbi:MAG: glycosyltransferase family 4 protein [Phycisphaerae bacterium]|nr:glycosyltransferase family 4 protein [Phycisphaerae bacterium]